MAAKLYKIDFEVESRLFEYKLKKLTETTMKSKRYWITEGAKAFLQATVKATPITQLVKEPRIRDPKSVVVAPIERVTKSTYRRRPVYRQGRKGNCFRVPFWTDVRKGWKTFSSMASAREFALIRNRGVARAAWIQAGKMAGLSVEYKQSGKDKIEPHALAIDAYSNAFWDVPSGSAKEVLTIGNSIRHISKYGWLAAKIGMRKAKNRMNYLLNQEKRRARIIWQG